MPEIDSSGDRLDRVIAALRMSVKYHDVSDALIRGIAAEELASHRHDKEAVKAIKGRLHQVFGAFFDQPPRYDRWLAELAAARAVGPAELRHACLSVMRRHASTRERLPILDRFYAETMALLPPPASIYDVGCGINPLAIPWMDLAPTCNYHCCDVDAALVGFLNAFFELIGVDGRAEVRDAAAAPPTQPHDLLIALKVLPTLDQVRRDAGMALLHASPAPHKLVSFPARSLGGRDKGMARTYETRFRAAAQAANWQAHLLAFPGEIVFVVSR